MINTERQTIKNYVQLRIPIEGKTFSRPILWSELMKTEGALPDDEINNIQWVDDVAIPLFGMDQRDAEPTIWKRAVVMVLRARPETDQEYFERMKQQTRKEDEERRTYLRLKAKYDPSDQASCDHVWADGKPALRRHEDGGSLHCGKCNKHIAINP